MPVTRGVMANGGKGKAAVRGVRQGVHTAHDGPGPGYLGGLDGLLRASRPSRRREGRWIGGSTLTAGANVVATIGASVLVTARPDHQGHVPDEVRVVWLVRGVRMLRRVGALRAHVGVPWAAQS